MPKAVACALPFATRPSGTVSRSDRQYPAAGAGTPVPGDGAAVLEVGFIVVGVGAGAVVVGFTVVGVGEGMVVARV